MSFGLLNTIIQEISVVGEKKGPMPQMCQCILYFLDSIHYTQKIPKISI